MPFASSAAISLLTRDTDRPTSAAMLVEALHRLSKDFEQTQSIRIIDKSRLAPVTA